MDSHLCDESHAFEKMAKTDPQFKKSEGWNGIFSSD